MVRDLSPRTAWSAAWELTRSVGDPKPFVNFRTSNHPNEKGVHIARHLYIDLLYNLIPWLLLGRNESPHGANNTQKTRSAHMIVALIIAWMTTFSTVACIAYVYAWQRPRAHADRAVASASARGVGCFRQVGAAQVGMLYVSMPLARIVISPDEVTIALFGKAHVFSKDLVREISQRRGLFSNAIRIEHDSRASGTKVIFWSSDLATLLAALENTGWPVRR